MATSSTSASMVSAPPFSFLAVILTPCPVTSVLSTFVPVSTRMPSLVKLFCKSALTSSSSTGRMRGIISTSVTVVPKGVVEVGELDADGPRAHDDHALGLFGERHGVAAADDRRAVEGQVGQRARGRAGGEQDFFPREGLFLAVRALDDDRLARP